MVYQIYIMLEIHHSGREPSTRSLWLSGKPPASRRGDLEIAAWFSRSVPTSDLNISTSVAILRVAGVLGSVLGLVSLGETVNLICSIYLSVATCTII